MTTKEAAERVGLAPSTLLAKARKAGVKLDTVSTGKRGRPGLRWTLAAGAGRGEGGVKMEARVGTLAVGTRFVTTLTGRSGVVRDHQSGLLGLGSSWQFRRGAAGEWIKMLHPDVRVRVLHEDFVH